MLIVGIVIGVGLVLGVIYRDKVATVVSKVVADIKSKTDKK